MTLNEWMDTRIKEDYSTGSLRFQLREKITCVDGFQLSVQAGGTHYCTPRVGGLCACDYQEFEVGFPTAREELLMPFIDAGELDADPLESVYGYVPRQVVEAVIVLHGGIAE